MQRDNEQSIEELHGQGLLCILTLKGLGHHMDIFLKVYKMTSVLSLHEPLVFKLFDCRIENI
jgi:hypothetical protein